MSITYTPDNWNDDLDKFQDHEQITRAKERAIADREWQKQARTLRAASKPSRRTFRDLHPGGIVGRNEKG